MGLHARIGLLLGVTGVNWLHDFESWLQAQGESFPAIHFHSRILQFLDAKPEHRESFLIEDGLVKAVSVRIPLDVPAAMPISDVLALKHAWDRHIVASQAGERSYLTSSNSTFVGIEQGLRLQKRLAWHVSALWVHA